MNLYKFTIQHAKFYIELRKSMVLIDFRSSIVLNQIYDLIRYRQSCVQIQTACKCSRLVRTFRSLSRAKVLKYLLRSLMEKKLFWYILCVRLGFLIFIGHLNSNGVTLHSCGLTQVCLSSSRKGEEN